MNSSRFAHFNTINPGCNGSSVNTPDNNNTSNNDNMIITAGIKFQSPANTGTFVTTVMNGHQRPHFERSTIFGPYFGRGEQEFITYESSELGKTENGSIGYVSFEDKNVATNGWNNGTRYNKVTYDLLNPLKPFKITVSIQSISRQYRFTVTRTNTVDRLKESIRTQIGLKPEKQKFVFAGQNLECGMTLGHYGLREGDKIFLTCCMREG